MSRAGGLRAALVASTLLLSSAPADAAGHRRFALVVGNDDGGRDTRPLLYASEDARRMHDVLTQYGNVAAADATLLLNRRAPELLGSLAALEARAAEARKRGQRTELILYYSGHAKEGALRLGDSRVSLEELKARLRRGAVDVLVGIFDSCRSGAVTRTKGARFAPAFDVQASGSDEARGTVFLTSSSADEDAQESDEIRGSYFSHHLESALRGGADRSGDNRVTLSEAYTYAYAATVAATAESAAGAQHPTFSYDLKGNGDLVLTDLGGRREGLLVPVAAPAGTYYIVRGDFIAAEVLKRAGAPSTIALRPGRYLIKRRLPDRLRIGTVHITAGQLTTLQEGGLRDAPFSDDPVKGARRGLIPSYSLTVAGSFQSFFDAPTREGLFPAAGMLGAELQVRDFFRRHWVGAIDLAAGGAHATLVRPSGVALPFRFSEWALGTSLFAEWPLGDGRFAPFAGVRLAFLLMTRTFATMEIPAQSFSTFSPGVVAGLRYRFAGDFSALARARLHYLLYNVDENRSLGYWELATAVSYEF